MSDTYLQELLEEKELLDPKSFVHSIRLLEDGKTNFLLKMCITVAMMIAYHAMMFDMFYLILSSAY